MPEMVVEKEVCGLCGVERRPGAAFCYHCGGDLAEPPGSDPAIPIPQEVLLDENLDNLGVSKGRPSANDKHASVEAAPAVLPGGKRRSRRKKPAPKSVEVEWKEPESIGVGYIVWSIVLLLLCAALVAVAMYIR
ncbi:MAG TPA: zinc ribbon domain-containing protein [Pyrinomonadaceae bacterium]|nr:zinc ribbon domain-containing protein [Pyrinomonadaceae bacterium]HMP65692.1 zinc ribbon domain-containing protein [Pyrinomonadaceae bacterium]